MLLLSAAGTVLAVLVALWLIDFAPATALRRGAVRGVLHPLRRADLLLQRVRHAPRRVGRHRPAVSGRVVGRRCRRTRPRGARRAAHGGCPRSSSSRSRSSPAIVCVVGLLWQSLLNVSAIRPAMDPDRPSGAGQRLVGLGGTDDDQGGIARRSARRAAGRHGASRSRAGRCSAAPEAAPSVPVELAGPATAVLPLQPGEPGILRDDRGARGARPRLHTSRLAPQSTLVVMVNESFATRFLGGGQTAIGSWVRTAGADRQVVGIVEDGPTNHLREAIEPYLYFPFAQRPTERSDVLRRDGR